MLIHRALLFLTALSLHAGFSLILGIFGFRTQQEGRSARWIIITSAFAILIYLPSLLVILGLYEFTYFLRGLIILVGVIATLAPFLYRSGAWTAFDFVWTWKRVAAISMLLLTAWCLANLYFESDLTAAPLAIAAAFAAFLSFQSQVQPG